MLRRLLTAVVVLGIAAIAGLAIGDALRSDGKPGAEPPRPAPEPRELPTVTEELLDAGAAGTIYVADTDCRVHGLRLPSLAELPGTAHAPACSFAVTPRGRVLEGDGWYPPRLARAVPEGDLVALRSPEGWVLRVEGRAPAWRPDGTLTVVRGGELRAVDESCDESDDCTRLLLGRDELRAASARPRRPGEVTLREAAWLDERRVALVVSFDRPGARVETALGIWDGRRLVRALPGRGEVFFDLRATPRGGFLTARVSDRPDNLLVLDRDGREVSPADLAGDSLGRPRFRFVRALALSPNERWVAIASRRGVYVFRRDRIGTPEVIRLRLNALDLVWQ
jgi:hypothetical protein